MKFEDNEIYTMYTISFEELQNIFPWFENLGNSENVTKKKKPGRKPKAHRASGDCIKMEVAE
jgi:hypothetical protein